MSDLLKINVNDHTERKGQLTYLSWAWAWAEVLKIDPKAHWSLVRLGDAAAPAFFMPDGSAMVGVAVTIKGDMKSCVLPVMDHKNKAIKNPDAFAINTAIMRCLAKAIAMHGLGLYIYAGEDLPEGETEDAASEPAPEPKKRTAHSGPALIFQSLQPEEQDLCRKVAASITEAMPDMTKVLFVLDMSPLDNDMKAGVWSLLDSGTRAAIKSAQSARDKAPAMAAGLP